ncbi:MAG: hypothetical protein ACJAZT_002093, partial [Gammaproteobacteria bacterium]
MSKRVFLAQVLAVFVGSALSLLTIAVTPDISQPEVTQLDISQLDFTKPEIDEHLSGGSATSLKTINH